MLLIGDIHINATYADKIVQGIQEYIAQYPDEQHIVFLGDYVYHFSYHKQSLLRLLDIFLELYTQGKSVYVLAGNHDWLSDSFVFEEAKNVFDTLRGDAPEVHPDQGRISFITEPTLTDIDGEKILFLPFMIDEAICRDALVARPLQTNETSNPLLQHITQEAQALQQSDNKYERFSGLLNHYLAQQIAAHPELTIIHHYYLANTQFPGQRTKFRFKDVALHEALLDISSIKLIAGHTHQPYTIKNFLCTGSLRHSSPGEVQHYKLLFRYNQEKVQATPLHINPYLLCEKFGEQLTQEDIDFVMDQVQIQTEKNMTQTGSSRQVDIDGRTRPSISDCTCIVQTSGGSYEKIDEIVEPALQKQMKDIRLKKNIQSVDSMIQQLDTTTKNLGSSLYDRKDLLHQRLQHKFGEGSERYVEVLQDLKLL